MPKKITNNNNNRLAIIIPAYNEAQNIGSLIENIEKEKTDAQIVIVDDSATDDTQLIIEKLQATNRRLHLIRRYQKSGRGLAVLAGLAYAQKHFHSQIFIEMDADLSHNTKEIKQLASHCSANTVAIASRYIKGSRIVNVPRTRRILSAIANQIIRYILKSQLNDNTNGFRSYSKEAVKIMLKHHYQSSGYIVLSETIGLLQNTGFKFVELPSIFYNRVKGKSNASLKEFLQSLKKIVVIRQQFSDNN